MRIVIKVGGSAIAPSLEAKRFSDYARVIKSLAREHAVLVVVGGGTPARQYISVSKELNASNALRDLIGIGVSRLNARLLISAMDDAAYPEPPHDYQEANLAMYSGKIVIMGGVQPGQTTDAVAAILAEYVHADLLIRTTSVDGVYSADPRVDASARKIDRMTPQELLELVAKMEMTAGANNIFDMLGAQIVKRSRIPMVIIGGNDPNNIVDAVQGKAIGTLVR